MTIHSGIRAKLKFFLSLLAIIGIFQTPSFFSHHNEGDELVYLGLASQMTWNVQNYTVQNLSPMNQFPSRLYRADTFLHPPLFPLLLKAGGLFGNQVFAGLIINGIIKFALAILTYLLGLRISLSENRARLASLFVVACPVIGYASSRLLIDPLYALAVTASLYYLVVASQDKSEKAQVLAALTFAVALNSKFQAVLLLPVFALGWLYVSNQFNWSHPAQRTRQMSVGGLSILILVVLGLSHHLRLLAEYGIQGIRDLWIVDRPLPPFVARMQERSHLGMIAYLGLIYPFFIAMLGPKRLTDLKRAIDSCSATRILLVYFVLMTLVTELSLFQQERYWTHILPVGFLLFIRTQAALDEKKEAPMPIGWLTQGALLLLFLNHFMTNVISAGDRTALVAPVLIQFFPFLIKPGTPFLLF